MSANAGYRQSEVESLPFIQLPLVVLADKKLNDGDKLTYCVLLRFAFQKSFSFPSMARIAAMLGKDRRTAQRHIGNLVKRGLLKVEIRKGTSNVYNRDGCLEKVYCDKGGYLKPGTIKMLLACGEETVVVRIKEERSEVIKMLRSAGVEDLPSEVRLPGDSDDDAGDEPEQAASAEGDSGEDDGKVRSLLPSFEQLKKNATSRIENSDAKVQGRKEKRVKGMSSTEREVNLQEKREAKEAELRQRAADGTLLNTKDIEAGLNAALKSKWPDKPKLRRRFTPKEYGQAKCLGNQWGFEDVIKAIEVIVEDWEEFMVAYGVKGYPSMGVIAGYGNSWIPEALEGKMDVGNMALAEGEYDDRTGTEKGGLSNPF